MTREEFITWAKSRGWQEDRFGHLQKTSTTDGTVPKQRRFKLSRIAVRYELKYEHGWVRFTSGYFTRLSIDPETLELYLGPDDDFYTLTLS